MTEVFRIEKDFDLGVGDGAYRLGSRQLVTALLQGLKNLKDEAGDTVDLALHVALALKAHGEAQCFATIDERYPMGTNKATHRLGLRDMVERIRQALDARIAEHGDQHPLLMQTVAVLKEAS